jgi:hypothetical protein
MVATTAPLELGREREWENPSESRKIRKTARPMKTQRAAITATSLADVTV